MDQACAALRGLGLIVGALCATSRAHADDGAPIQVASIQTMIARGTRPRADLVILDECHHYAATGWREALGCYQSARVIGFTATPERTDGVGLGEIFDSLVVGARTRELIAGGYLVPPQILRPAEALKPGQIALRPVDAYLSHARGRRALVFCSRVPQALRAMQEFRIGRQGAEIITAETKWDDRQRAFDALRAGRLEALIGVGVFNEGFDLPEVDCIILSRRFATAGSFLQAAGRGMRPAPGKSDLLILDLAGATHAHGSPADDREFSLEGRGIRAKTEDDVVGAMRYCRVCGAPQEGDGPCPDCGSETPVLPLKVLNKPLVPYAAKRAEPADKRIETLRRWIAIGRAKGYKPGWALFKYNAVYGTYPPDDIRQGAMRP